MIRLVKLKWEFTKKTYSLRLSLMKRQTMTQDWKILKYINYTIQKWSECDRITQLYNILKNRDLYESSWVSMATPLRIQWLGSIRVGSWVVMTKLVLWPSCTVKKHILLLKCFLNAKTYLLLTKIQLFLTFCIPDNQIQTKNCWNFDLKIYFSYL